MDLYGGTIVSDNDASFLAPPFQAVMREFGLKHVRVRTYSSNAAAVERVQQTVRRAIGKWKTQTGRSDWSNHLGAIVHSYNTSTHSAIKVAPAIALQGFLRQDAESIRYVREQQQRYSKKRTRSGRHL